MRPTTFPQANGTLGGGPAERYGTADDVVDLPVHRTGAEIISCWRLSWRERLAVLLSGRVWLRVLAARTHAPVAVDADSPFEEPR
jgi:hypothetical protein